LKNEAEDSIPLHSVTSNKTRSEMHSLYTLFIYWHYAILISIGRICDLYSLPSIVRVVKSRRMIWAGHVARMGEGRGVHSVLVGKPEERKHWGDPDVDGRIILRWIFRKWEEVFGTGWSWLRIGGGGGHL
jgi:hypothetical protein